MGYFDIVNLRLFGLVIQNNDPGPVLRNLIRMLSKYHHLTLTAVHIELIRFLEPNGYIQWCEADQSSHRIQTTSPSVPTQNLAELWRQTSIIASGLMAPWVKTLPESLEAEGLLDVVADWKTGDPHTLTAMHWCNMPLYEMLERQLRQGNPEKADEFVRLIQGSVEEAKSGAMYVFDRVLVVGRKAA